MKLRSLVLALIAVVSASAMATPCDEQITFTTSVRPTTNTVSVNDLKSFYTGVSEVATSNAIESFKLAWSFYYSNSRNGRSAKKILIDLNKRNDIKISSVGMLNHDAATSAAKMIESSDNLNKVKACEETKACSSVMDQLKQAKDTINAATAPADLDGITVPACPATRCPECADLRKEVENLLNQKKLELNGTLEDNSISAWERKFEAVAATGSPTVEGSDLLAELKGISANFRQTKNIAKVADLEAKVKTKFAKPCFNAEFTSTDYVRSNALSGLKELKQTYTIKEIETILKNADYYSRIYVSTGGGDVVKDHVSMCALVWMISAYNKNVGDSYEKRVALASLLVSKFGEENNGESILTNLFKFSIPTTITKLGESTKKIDVTNIYSKLIEDQIKKWMPDYKTPVTQQDDSDFTSWLDQKFNTNPVVVDNESFQDLISALLSLSSDADLDVVVQKLFDKFGSTTNDAEAVKKAISAARSNKTQKTVKDLIDALLINTEITKESIGGNDGINYIVDAVVGSTTVVNPTSNPQGSNPQGNGAPLPNSNPFDTDQNGQFNSTEVFSFINDQMIDPSTSSAKVTPTNMKDLVSMLLNLEHYDDNELNNIVDNILVAFGNKGDYNANRTAIVNAIKAVKQSKTNANVQALIKTIIDNTNINISDIGGVAGIAEIANQIVPATSNTPNGNQLIPTTLQGVRDAAPQGQGNQIIPTTLQGVRDAAPKK